MSRFTRRLQHSTVGRVFSRIGAKAAPAREYFGRGVGYAAPIVGGALFGAPGAAAFGAAGSGLQFAILPGDREHKARQAKRFGAYSLGVATVFGGASLASGSSIAAPGFQSIAGIFGGGGPAAPAPGGRSFNSFTGEYENDILPPSDPLVGASPSGGVGGFLGRFFGGAAGARSKAARQELGVGGLGGLAATGGVGSDAAPGFTPNMSPEEQAEQSSGRVKMLLLLGGAAAVLWYITKGR